ncbi:USP domain-containing protein [Mycena kentingensis (nom. inval.)]|nr:USP domain-containing protein [Mycena kentingensis (nom. inval.)]
MRTTIADVVQQVAPLAALILIPLFAVQAFTFLRPRFYRFVHLLMALGALLPWNWGGHEKEASAASSEGGNGRKRVCTRAGQVAEAKSAKPGVEKSPEWEVARPGDAHFPGLVNMSGTHCFMNSTLQSLASLSALSLYLLSIRTRAEALDVPTPVVDALIDLIDSLNTPAPSGRPLRATGLVEALCSPPPSMEDPEDTPAPSAASALSAFWGSHSASSSLNLGASAKATALLASHEHQDAQELFQLVSECVREDSLRVAKEGKRDRGFAATPIPAEGATGPSLTSPFDGLTATRRSCVRCGYTAAIRHFAFDTVQLALESAGGGWGGTSVYHLLRAYTTLEVLHDCACRRCELRATAKRLREEVERLEVSTSQRPDPGSMRVDAGVPIPNGDAHVSDEEEPDEEEDLGSKSGKKKKKKHKSKQADGPTPSSLRRLKLVRKMEARVLRALETGRIEEEELEGDWDWENKTDGGFVHGAGGDALKGVRIERVPGGVATRQSMFGRPPTVLALHINRSVHTGMRVAKNGAHVAFPEILDLAPYTTDGVLNLAPTASLSGSNAPGGILNALAGATVEGQRPASPTPCLYRLAAVVCHFGQHSFGHYICYRRAPTLSAGIGTYAPCSPVAQSIAGTGTGWLRISDARVDRCGVEQVLAEGNSVFMLYYERIQSELSSPSASASAETRSAKTASASALPLPAATLLSPQVYDVEGAADSAETIRPAQLVGTVGVGVGAGDLSKSAHHGHGPSASFSAGGLAALVASESSSRARVVRSVMLGSRGAASSSSLSLPLASSASTSPERTEQAGGTPKLAGRSSIEPSEADADADEVAEHLILDEAQEQAPEQEQPADAKLNGTLPTPPLTPRELSEAPQPTPAKSKKKKKKKPTAAAAASGGALQMQPQPEPHAVVAAS